MEIAHNMVRTLHGTVFHQTFPSQRAARTMLRFTYELLNRYEQGLLNPFALLILAVVCLLAWMTYAATWALIAWLVLMFGRAITGI